MDKEAGFSPKMQDVFSKWSDLGAVSHYYTSNILSETFHFIPFSQNFVNEIFFSTRIRFVDKVINEHSE